MTAYVPLFILLLFIMVLFLRPFIVLLHELGHAIPALILTKEKAVVFLGSYGNPNKSLKLSIGLLEIWIGYNPLFWGKGMFVSQAKNFSINKTIAITLTGLVTSFVIAAIAIYITFAYDFHGFLKLLLVVFMILSIINLLQNLILSRSSVELYDGSIAYSDGYLLKKLFYFKKFPQEFRSAIEHYNNKKFKEAAEQLDKIPINEKTHQDIFRLAISTYMQNNHFDKAKIMVGKFMGTSRMNPSDYTIAGSTYARLGDYRKSLELYEKALHLEPNYTYALSNKGYTLNLMGNYMEAITLFDRAIEIDPLFAYAYNNRGLAKFKIGKIDDGLQDIMHSLDIDEHNAYGYRNLGIYHQEIKEDHNEALKLFNKAKQLDPNTHLIDDLILTAEQKTQGRYRL